MESISRNKTNRLIWIPETKNGILPQQRIIKIKNSSSSIHDVKLTIKSKRTDEIAFLWYVI